MSARQAYIMPSALVKDDFRAASHYFVAVDTDMLKLQFKDRHQSPVWVVEKLYNIGSASDNNLVLQDEGIAPLHARLITTANKVFLKDNNSIGGCYVNGQRITQKEVLPGDWIRLGNTELEVMDPSTESEPTVGGADEWRLIADGSSLSGRNFNVLPHGPTIIGRSSQCDIVIPGSHLSRQHAELKVQKGSLLVKDLDSVNGTYLNDQPITTAVAHSGDRLRLDVYSFRVVGPNQHPRKARARPPEWADTKPRARAIPVEQVARRWQTRPTSPGNRPEPDRRKQQRELWLWLLVVVLAAVLVGTIYWV